MSDDIDLHMEELRHLMQDHAKRATEAFAQYVIDEAGHRIVVEQFDTDAVVECMQRLEADGYRVDDRPNGPGKVAIASVNPSLFQEIRNGVDDYVRLNREVDSVDAPGSVTVYAVDIKADASMPERVGVVIHPDAIIPNKLAETFSLGTQPLSDKMQTPRPWLVHDPNGVVVVEVEA